MAASSQSTIVCFDLGGVVVRIARDWQEGCAAAGVDVRSPDDFHEPTIKARRRDLADQYQCGLIDDAAFFTGVAANTAGLYTADEIECVHHAWILGEYPGIAALIEEINTLPGLVSACLSNTNAAHWTRALAGTPPTHVPSPAIDALRIKLASHDLGLIKPDPEIYRAAQTRFDHPPERIVFFDDLPDNIAAARAAGWNAHQIDHTGDTASQVRRVLTELGLLAAAAPHRRA